MTRAQAIAQAEGRFDDGTFFADLARRVAIPSTAQEPDKRPYLDAYLTDEIGPTVAAMGFDWKRHDNPDPGGGPFLVAQRIEDPALPTMLCYGHGDVVRGQEEDWRDGLNPWHLTAEGDRWYGRGTADNKGQHSINLAALQAVLAVRGRLGFNCKLLVEMSEEVGSLGLAEFASSNRDALAADLLLASDGPRLQPEQPTLFLGTRGAFNFELDVDLRPGAHHSGNWGGLIANAGVRLSQALASLVGPRGEILVPALKPAEIPAAVREALAGVTIDGGADAPEIDRGWGEPGLTPPERVFAWNSLEILSFTCGNPAKVVNAIPPSAHAWCQIRFTVDTDPASFLPALRRHLDAAGFADVSVRSSGLLMQATRLSPDHPWARWASDSVAHTLGRPPVVVPSLGGSLPNDVFADILDLPTVWVPHSYSGCSQHAADEHALTPILRQGLAMMAGLFWDLGSGDAALPTTSER